jgi:hypothetical protein
VRVSKEIYTMSVEYVVSEYENMERVGLDTSFQKVPDKKPDGYVVDEPTKLPKGVYFGSTTCCLYSRKRELRLRHHGKYPINVKMTNGGRHCIAIYMVKSGGIAHVINVHTLRIIHKIQLSESLAKQKHFCYSNSVFAILDKQDKGLDKVLFFFGNMKDFGSYTTNVYSTGNRVVGFYIEDRYKELRIRWV